MNLLQFQKENMNKRGFKGISSALLKTLSNESNESTFVIVYKAFLQESTIAAAGAILRERHAAGRYQQAANDKQQVVLARL